MVTSVERYLYLLFYSKKTLCQALVANVNQTAKIKANVTIGKLNNIHNNNQNPKNAIINFIKFLLYPTY